MNAIDTNILLYVHDPRDAAKQAQAASLVQAQTDAILLWQVACEYLAASRKLASQGYAFSQACEDIADLRRVWYTVLPSWGALSRANQLIQRYSLSFWDALLIAACLEAGVQRLYTEDFSAYPDIDGLKILNPFRAEATG
jgi:predicted nucleic acid-binding protein